MVSVGIVRLLSPLMAVVASGVLFAMPWVGGMGAWAGGKLLGFGWGGGCGVLELRAVNLVFGV